jgi:hypothetical protein
MITQEMLRNLFDYDDGVLIWRDTGKGRNKKVAGHIDHEGYVRIGINRKLYRRSRLVFLYFYGYLPETIDHINRIRTDDRIENLRAADYSLNNSNRDLKLGKSRERNIILTKHNSFKVKIRRSNRYYHLGTFQKIEDAVNAREQFLECYTY